MANHFQDQEDWIVVPIFSGENLSVWIAEIEELMIRYEVPMIQWVNFSHVYVTGSARKWVGMHYDEICQMDWSNFLVALRVEFDASSSVEELLVDETVIDSLVEENGFTDILYVGVEQKGCRSGQINFASPKGSILGIVDQASHREIPGMIPFYYVAASQSSLVDITPSKGNNIAAPARTIVHNIITSSYIMADEVEGYDFSDTNFSWEPGPVLQTPDGLHKSVLAVNHFPNGDTPWALLEELLLLLYDTSTANGDSFILTISLPCRRSIFSQLGICGGCVHSSMIEFQYGGDSTATANKLQCLDIGGFTTMLVTKVECLGEQLFKLGIGLNLGGSAFPDWNVACTVLLVILNIPCAIVGLAPSLLFGTASPGKEVSHIEMLMMFRSCFHPGIVYLTAGDADKMLSVNTEVRYLDSYLGLPGHPGMVSGKSQCCKTVIHFASSSIVLCFQRLNMKDEALITKLMHYFGYNDRPATITYIGYLDSEILRQRKISVICIFSPNLLHLTSWLLQGWGATNVILAECEIVFGFLSTVLVLITSYKWSIQIVHISCYVGTEVIVVGQQQHAWVGLATKFFSIICLAGSHIGSQGSGSEGLQGAIHHTSAQSMVILVPSVDKISKIEYVLVFYKITHRIIYLKVGCHWINSCLSTCLETNESFAGFSPDPGIILITWDYKHRTHLNIQRRNSSWVMSGFLQHYLILDSFFNCLASDFEVCVFLRDKNLSVLARLGCCLEKIESSLSKYERVWKWFSCRGESSSSGAILWKIAWVAFAHAIGFAQSSPIGGRYGTNLVTQNEIIMYTPNCLMLAASLQAYEETGFRMIFYNVANSSRAVLIFYSLLALQGWPPPCNLQAVCVALFLTLTLVDTNLSSSTSTKNYYNFGDCYNSSYNGMTPCNLFIQGNMIVVRVPTSVNELQSHIIKAALVSTDVLGNINTPTAASVVYVYIKNVTGVSATSWYHLALLWVNIGITLLVLMSKSGLKYIDAYARRNARAFVGCYAGVSVYACKSFYRGTTLCSDASEKIHLPIFVPFMSQLVVGVHCFRVLLVLLIVWCSYTKSTVLLTEVQACGSVHYIKSVSSISSFDRGRPSPFFRSALASLVYSFSIEKVAWRGSKRHPFAELVSVSQGTLFFPTLEALFPHEEIPFRAVRLLTLWMHFSVRPQLQIGIFGAMSFSASYILWTVCASSLNVGYRFLPAFLVAKISWADSINYVVQGDNAADKLHHLFSHNSTLDLAEEEYILVFDCHSLILLIFSGTSMQSFVDRVWIFYGILRKLEGAVLASFSSTLRTRSFLRSGDCHDLSNYKIQVFRG